MKDKYEHERFDSYCPTCGQHFLKEQLDIAIQGLSYIKNSGKYKTGNEDDMYVKAKETLEKLGFEV